jgi:hypothetical protein
MCRHMAKKLRLKKRENSDFDDQMSLRKWSIYRMLQKNQVQYSKIKNFEICSCNDANYLLNYFGHLDFFYESIFETPFVIWSPIHP